ncbi:hypothetical protein [Chitinimonas naiadis]
MAFSDAEKTDIRRFCGYGAFGSQALPASGYRFFTAYGTMEYKLTNLLPAEEAVVRTTYLTNLGQLETDIFAVRGNLDTAQAAVWVHNPHEHADRERLFASVRRKLCGFLGIPPGPELANGGGISLVV